MAHSITAIIGQSQFMLTVKAKLNLPQPITIGHGLSLIPWVHEESHEELPAFNVGDDEQGTRLDPGTEASLREASTEGKILLISTEYFGGFGGQGAVIFQDGEIVHGPLWAEAEVINKALERLGVQETEDDDQFDLVGLGRHRHTMGWLTQTE